METSYIDQIDSIFLETIKYIHRGVLSYLIVNHYDRLKSLLDRKLTIISRFDNIGRCYYFTL